MFSGLDALDQYQVLTAMLAPALLMAATASLLISANARLARVVDRLRFLQSMWEDAGAAQRERLGPQIERHRIRSKHNLRACLMLYLALAAFVVTSMSLALDAFTNFALGPLPTVIALVGTACLLLASTSLAIEVTQALRSLDSELDNQTDT